MVLGPAEDEVGERGRIFAPPGRGWSRARARPDRHTGRVLPAESSSGASTLVRTPTSPRGTSRSCANCRGSVVAPDTWVFPRLRVVAMGWTHALHLCQRVLESVTERTGFLGADNRVVDKARVPEMQPDVHAEYVDNFVAFSQSNGAAANAANSVMRELQRAGLRAHPVESGRGGEALGWFFSSDEPLMAAKPRRLWRVRLAMQHAMRRPTLCGRDVEVLIGHCTHHFLAKRELLSCFSAVYKFM